MKFFDLSAELKLDFQNFFQNKMKKKNFELELESQKIKNFCLNGFLKNIMSFNISEDFLKLTISELKLILNLSYVDDW